jgi:protease-4
VSGDPAKGYRTLENMMEVEKNGSELSPRSPLGIIMTFLVIIVIPLVIGLFLAPRIIAEPKIGLVHLNYDIDAPMVQEMLDQLAYAREDDAIKAIVMVVNSPGGSAAYSEELFLDILNTRRQKPVIATVDLLAASGAYYAAAAADEIYAKPTSSIGSIGVIAVLPGPVFIDEDLLTTGPYKAFGGTRDSFMRQMEISKLTFLEAVEAGRGDRLVVEPALLSRAEIFNGSQAEAMGLVDGLLASDEAIQRAAELAGIKNYQVVELSSLVSVDDEDSDDEQTQVEAAAVDPRRLWATPKNLPAGIYYRYIVPPG